MSMYKQNLLKLTIFKIGNVAALRRHVTSLVDTVPVRTTNVRTAVRRVQYAFNSALFVRIYNPSFLESKIL